MIHFPIRRTVICLLGGGLGLALSGCRVGPDYVRPTVSTAPAFKESLPDNFKSEDGWKPAQPSDAQLKDDWWTLFNDPQLNTLEADRPGQSDAETGGGELPCGARGSPLQSRL